jgi:hypothetical protein
MEHVILVKGQPIITIVIYKNRNIYILLDPQYLKKYKGQ